jgi:hypothetical protein
MVAKPFTEQVQRKFLNNGLIHSWSGQSIMARYSLIVILSLAGLFYFVAWPQAPIATSDTLGYQAVAQDIQKHDFGELRLRPPGYPLLLLFTGSATELHKGLFAVSLVLHLASIALLYRLLFRCGTAIWLTRTFVILALLPMYVEPAAFAITEVLTGFLITLAVVQAVEGAVSGSQWRFLASGAALAYAGVTHPLFLIAFIPVTIALAALRWPLRWSRLSIRKSVGGGICLTLVALIGVLSLFLFNSLAYGFKGISPFGGITLCTKTATFIERLPESYGEARRVMIKDRDEALIDGKSHPGESYMWSARESLKQVTGFDAVEVDALLKKMNLELIRGSPLLYLNAVGHSIANFWMPRTTSSFHCKWLQLACGIISGLAVLIWAMMVVLLGACGLFMTRQLYRASKPVGHGLAGTGVFLRGVSFQIISNFLVCWTCLIASAFSIGEIRFRAPVELLLLASAVHGVHLLTRIFKFVYFKTQTGHK